MTDFTISTLVRESPAAIAAAICAVWQADVDTPAVYAEQCRVNDVDFTHSIMAHDSAGRLAGIGMLCRRGDCGFVLDFGVAPRFRGKGFGHQLFRALHAQMGRANLYQVSLLVNTDNAPAIRIYEQAGFRRVREIVTLRGKMAAYAPGSADEIRDGLPETIMAWFGPGKSARPQWERDLPSLLSMANVRAFENSRGFMLARKSLYFPQVDIVHLGLDPDAQAEDVNALLCAVSVAFGPDFPLNLPEEPMNSRAHRQLRDLGFQVVDRAYEMAITL
jgi:GNAT superfamily N-acetyltransferase